MSEPEDSESGCKAPNQGAMKRAIKAKIQAAGMFNPTEDWVFDIDEIPIDQNVSDYVMGALELARLEGMITQKQLKQFPLLYTQGGKAREDRKRGGRAFKDPDANSVALGHIHLEGDSDDDERCVPGIYAINTLRNAPGYQSLRTKIFDKRVSSTKRHGSPGSPRHLGKKSRESVKEHENRRVRDSEDDDSRCHNSSDSGQDDSTDTETDTSRPRLRSTNIRRKASSSGLPKFELKVLERKHVMDSMN